jgi:hypothetical protein
MAELVGPEAVRGGGDPRYLRQTFKEGKTRFISLSECSAESLKRVSAVHPLVSLQMEFSLFSGDAEEQGQIRRLQGTWHGDDGLCRGCIRPLAGAAVHWLAQPGRPASEQQLEELAAILK